MKVIIAGSREIVDSSLLIEALIESNFEVTKIISGGARGADRIGEQYSRAYNIPLTVIKPDWDKYGKRAGYKRNEQMAEVADALIALWDGKSKGTKHMIDLANDKGLMVYTKIQR